MPEYRFEATTGDNEICEQDARYKLKVKNYTDAKRCAKLSDLAVGDKVLLKRDRNCAQN